MDLIEGSAKHCSPGLECSSTKSGSPDWPRAPCKTPPLARKVVGSNPTIPTRTGRAFPAATAVTLPVRPPTDSSHLEVLTCPRPTSKEVVRTRPWIARVVASSRRRTTLAATRTTAPTAVPTSVPRRSPRVTSVGVLPAGSVLSLRTRDVWVLPIRKIGSWNKCYSCPSHTLHDIVAGSVRRFYFV
jgi:hypothetical protein